MLAVSLIEEVYVAVIDRQSSQQKRIPFGIVLIGQQPGIIAIACLGSRNVVQGYLELIVAADILGRVDLIAADEES